MMRTWLMVRLSVVGSQLGRTLPSAARPSGRQHLDYVADVLSVGVRREVGLLVLQQHLADAALGGEEARSGISARRTHLGGGP